MRIANVLLPQLHTTIFRIMLDFRVDMSTLRAKEESAMQETHKTPRKIVGFSMAPALAIEVKKEAAERGLSLRALFEEMWALYTAQRKVKKN